MNLNKTTVNNYYHVDNETKQNNVMKLFVEVLYPGARHLPGYQQTTD